MYIQNYLKNTEEPSFLKLDGVALCARYAFGPNRLHYCGPDANQEILSYIKEGVSDPGIEALLKQFQTMYPYLQYIARANKIRDPFDIRVVEAYWIGNSLLDTIDKQSFYRHLLEDQNIKNKVGPTSFEKVKEKIKRGALPHHSFHVFNIWKRTGNLEEAHTLESMNECRISSGKVTNIDGPFIAVETRPLVFVKDKLALGSLEKRKIARSLESSAEIDELKIGDIVSIHWGVPCEVINEAKEKAIERYTLKSVALANESV